MAIIYYFIDSTIILSKTDARIVRYISAVDNSATPIRQIAFSLNIIGI